MSNGAIENSVPTAEAEKPKTKGKPSTKAKKSKPKAEQANKNAENRTDETRQGCHTSRTRDSHRLPGAHGPRLRQHPGQEGR
jgi:hypothetical protein